MKPFDRTYFAPWNQCESLLRSIGALLMAMQHIGEEAQQRHGAKESNLRWGQSAPRVRYDARVMAPHRASRRAFPESRFAAIKLTPYCLIML